MSIDGLVFLASAAIGGLGLGLWLAWLGLRRLMAAERLMRTVRGEVERLSREGEELKPYALQLGERVTALEKRLRHVADRQSQVESRARSGPDYDQAIRMAKGGAGPDELTRQCGLGQSEARLIVAIHGAREA